MKKELEGEHRQLYKEIGSEFWEVNVDEHENFYFPSDTRWFISGTAALETIVLDILNKFKIESVALPSWCCNCMITPFLKHGLNVVFYPVYLKDGFLTCNYNMVSADCWLLLSYFGYTSQINIGNPKGIIIRDITHSIFTQRFGDAHYYFGSLRKWAGFYTGGYAWSSEWALINPLPVCDEVYVSLRRTAMNLKKSYILGDLQTKEYLALFEKGENYLDCCDPMQAYSSDIEQAHHMDVMRMKSRRQRNAKVLLEALKPWAIFKDIQKDDCPLFVPIVMASDKRDALRNYLKSKDIYCPIHWSVEVEHQLDSLTADLYEREMSIVCDQRYDEKDMLFILNTINESGVMRI